MDLLSLFELLGAPVPHFEAQANLRHVEPLML